MDENIAFSPPDISEKEIDAVTEVLRSGWITTGSKTKEFEHLIAEYCGTERAVCLNSATSALGLTLRILGIGRGDEVITTAYTYSASASVICHVGAKPVLVDTAPGSFLLDYNAVERAVTEKTKAIIAVDVAGMMCDYNRLVQITQAKMGLFRPKSGLQQAMGRLAVIADAAHSFGAEYNGQVSGSAADFSCFSFHAVKNLTTSEGGAVTWKTIEGVSNEELYHLYMLFSLHGQSKDAFEKTLLGNWEYDIVALGFKCNMPDILAAVGLAQFERFPSFLQRRLEIVKGYEAALGGSRFILPQHFAEGMRSSLHLYPVRLKDADEKQRNQVINRMAEGGVSTNVHYKPLPMFTAYKRLGFKIQDFPNAFAQYQNELTLPLHTLLSDDDVAYVADTLKKVSG
ncbi:DegT/DnrJ/EryC1/StrS family aminotransferase [Acetanaerobacterium elongatum]|uniref:dTDP-4-amino-4,6-dideoxygalactose transaminase n=1 Tax=Acetanaerobacterium elongatum TaxID=258515 RepID=A0A1G9TX04_9FIRM|nr:DegT/DnrJ/EryC1/StrS family aminotransferase [Acetanaerobacterium elongatum]SDM51934.1 dTDP-4-amino-4,6-dideoxygalactose transaminase [Acetanaerobacterium elongatum]